MHQTTSLYKQMNYQNVRANKLTTKKKVLATEKKSRLSIPLDVYVVSVILNAVKNLITCVL